MTTRPDFDVVVVGAGAGGAAAAYFLTQAGLQVLVMEKASLPRYKACGGAIPWPTLERFPFRFDDLVRAEPTEVLVSFPGLTSVKIPLPDTPVAMVMRSEFDAYLLGRSEAEVWDNAPVTAITERDADVHVETGRRKVTARYLVGADGASSVVARSLGLRPNRQMGAALEVEVPLDGRASVRPRVAEIARSRAIFSLGAVPGGYAWVFPKGDLLSVGVGRFRPGRVDLHRALERELGLLDIEPDGLRPVGHPIPSYQARPWLQWHVRPQEKLSTRRCLLVGDAAGLVDPLLGEGIRYAIGSARLAAHAITEDDLTGYESTIWRKIGHSLATAALTAWLFYRWPRRCFQWGVGNPQIVRQFVELLAERVSYQYIGRRLLAATARRLLGRVQE